MTAAALAEPGRADVALVAEASALAGAPAFRLWLGGAPTTLLATPADAPVRALDAARAFLRLASTSGRIADHVAHSLALARPRSAFSVE